MKTFIIFIRACLFFTPIIASEKSIHIIGDSHASFCFTHQKPVATAHEKYDLKIGNDIFHLNVFWLVGRTMFRIGRDGVKGINLRGNHVIKDGDIVVFCFGEIDVRCHIGKQQKQFGRSIQEIIESLALHYIHTIKKTQKLYNNLTCIVFNVIPPIFIENNPEYPTVSSLEERIVYTKMLNAALADLCKKTDLLFLDVYDDFSLPSGSLDPRFSDGNIHIAPEYNRSIKTKLFEMIAFH
ncbi:MAG: SGNH/GDSL hydrolase family protein [Candidatus Babeliales bacterium]